MASYEKPNESLPEFNNAVFTDANTTSLSLSKAKSLFLARTGYATSTATSTDFSGTLTTGTINGITLYPTNGTKVGTGNSTGSSSANCVIFGDNIKLGNTPSYTNQNILIGSNIAGGGDLQYNTVVGTNIFKLGAGQTNNVAIGFSSCYGGGGNNTTAVGYTSAYNTTVGQNVAVGASSLYANTSGTGNIAVGYNAFNTGATFSNSTALGASSVIGASNSTAVGYGATTSVANSIVLGTATETVYCVGTSALGSLIASADIYVNGTIRMGMGNNINASYLTPATSFNTAVGFGALADPNMATYNCTAVGYNALNKNQTGYSSTAIGTNALSKQTGGSSNTAVGVNAMLNFIGGSGNCVAVGERAGYTNNAGNNTFLGYFSGTANTGSSNVFVGASSGNASSNSSDNVMVGANNTSTVATTTGNQNTFIGSKIVCSGTTVSNSTALGYQSSVVNFSNSTVIGVGATATAANQVVLGRTSETVYCVGTSATLGSLVLSGGLQLQTAYTATPTSTMLGFQLSNAGFAIASFTTATPTNISSAGFILTAGIWSINYSIELAIAGAITTATAQTLYSSLASGGIYSTQRISNSGITRIHTTYTYAIGDTPAFSGSFSYYVTVPTTIFPVFQINFTGGTVSGTGYYTATRIG